MTPIEERPARAAVVWAEQGLINRIVDDPNPKSMQMLSDQGIPTKAYPGFMEDPKLGPFVCFVLDKTNANVDSNGWDRCVGNISTLSMDSDHLDMPMHGHVHTIHARLEEVLTYFLALEFFQN